jgi:hypothetical protein
MVRFRYYFAWFLFIGSLFAWPITAMTVFRHEPQGVLGLSWFAITLTALDILSTTDVRQQQDGEEQ